MYMNVIVIAVTFALIDGIVLVEYFSFNWYWMRGLMVILTSASPLCN